MFSISPVPMASIGGTSCNDNLYCTGVDQCDGVGACSLHSGDPCVNNAECNNQCNETADNCLAPITAPVRILSDQSIFKYSTL